MGYGELADSTEQVESRLGWHVYPFLLRILRIPWNLNFKLKHFLSHISTPEQRCSQQFQDYRQHTAQYSIFYISTSDSPKWELVQILNMAYKIRLLSNL